MENVPGYIFSYVKTARLKTLSWAVQAPVLALTLVILIGGVLLPLVSAAALMPIVALLNVGDYLESKGFLAVMYAVFCQGIMLAVILVVLFFLAFALATGACVLHSYNFVPPVDK